jgi:hypothetical protein
MSNEEKLRIEKYKKRRERLIFIQTCIIAIFTIVFIALIGSYASISQTTNINYYETSSIDYKVALTNNDLYTEDELGEDYAFVSSLIKNITADISYKVQVEKEEVSINYSYKIDAKLIIIDKTTGKEIYKPVYPLVETKTGNVVSNTFTINQNVVIDYNKYNAEAINFIKQLNLPSTSSKVIISTTCNFNGVCGTGDGIDDKSHTFDLIVPLNETVTDIKESNTNSNVLKVLSCEQTTQRNAIMIAFIVIGCIDALAALVLLAYTYKTRNCYINYSIKVKRIVKSYKSFIQQIKNKFDMSNYQVLYLATINEMLEIRDTLQAPILMNENEDKTMTQFVIPGTNNILYVFEIKIENYDEIYQQGSTSLLEPVVEEVAPVEEPPVIQENVTEEEKVENNAVPTEVETSTKSTYGHNYSFEAKLSLAKSEVKEFYQTLTKAALEHGVKVTRSYKKERIHLGRIHIATLVFKGKTLCILFPIDPKDPSYEKYNFVDMTGYNKYSDNPSMIKITSSRKLKYSIEVMEKLFEHNNIEDKNLTVKNVKIKTRTKKSLFKEGLIKENN